MKSQTILSVFMGLFVILFLTIGSSIAGASNGLYRQGSLAAVLSELEGDVQARDSADGQFAKAADGQSLPILGQVQTGTDGRARLDLSSGTIIRVAPSSLFTFEANEADSSGSLSSWFNLEVGKLWIVLNGGSLDVNVPSGVAAVQGSYMSVQVNRFTDDKGNQKVKITVTCFEGDCAVNNRAGSVSLMAGQAAEFEYDVATGSVTAPAMRDMTEDEINEWLTLIAETQSIMDSAFATMTALPANTPVPTEQNGSVPALGAVNSGSYVSNPRFSLGAAQVSITDPLAGVVTASLIRLNQFAVSQTVDHLELISHGVSIEMSGAGNAQICFAYPPVRSNLKVVRWDPSGQTGALPGRWTNMDTYKQGPTACARVPAGVFALAGL